MIVSLDHSGGLNLYVNPLVKKETDLIRAVNVQSYPYGAKEKRPGYGTAVMGSAPNGSAVKDLFSFYKNDGATFYTYLNAGTNLYYSLQGTGAWTVMGNGSIPGTAHVDYDVLNDTLFVADSVSTLRYTSNGTSLTAGSLAPIAVSVCQFQNTIYAAGTASTLFKSTSGDGTNWSTSGTSDSSSFTIPGGGRLLKVFKQNGRLLAAKSSGQMYKWDGFNLQDMATSSGPSSPYAIHDVEDYTFWFNRNGHYTFGGINPQLLSNAIQRQIYNRSGSAIAGTVFDNMMATVHRFDYLASVGTITDDFTEATIPNAIIKYDYQKNEYLNWSTNTQITALTSYTDTAGNTQLLTGDAGGQVYQFAGTALNDNGNTIEAVMEYVVVTKEPHLDKEWKYYWFYFNPGNEAKLQVAYADSFNRSSLNWVDLQDCSTGVAFGRFPTLADNTPRSKFLFVRVSESSRNSNFQFYGGYIEAEPIPIK